MGLTLPQGRLFGAVVEAILYGVNVILILAALCLLGQHNEPSYTQRARVSLIFVIFVLCTMHLTAVLEGVRQAFFEWPSPDEYYRDISQPPNVIANAAYGVAVMVADGIMIHRVYIIFGNRWKVILVPCFSTVVTAAVWFVLVHVCRMAPRNPDTYLSIVGRLAPAAYILSFATNIIITMQIIIRIVISMRLVRDLRPESGCFHRRCLAYTIESGVLYPLSLLATGILWFLKNDSLDILAGSNLQLLCMVPILLSLQMRLRLSIYDAAKGFQITPFPTRVSGMSQTSQHPQTVHRSRLPSLTLPVGFRDGRRGLPANGLIHISDEMLQSQSLPSPASTDDSTMSSQLVK